MRRHTPTLFTHEENESDDEDANDWDVVRPHSSYSVSSSTSSIKSRMKLRSRKSYSSNAPPSQSSASITAATAGTPSSSSSSARLSKYSDVYSQFIRRYRSGPDVDDDPRNDPDSHYIQRGLGQLNDLADSDDEDLPAGAELTDRFSSLVLDAEPLAPTTLAERERLEWQTMLASVLGGDVLKSEKTRIATVLGESTAEEKSRLDIWLGIRAKLHGRTDAEERASLDERRLRLVDAVIADVRAFRVRDGEGADGAMTQVRALLARLDVAHALYPTLRAFYLDKPAAAEPEFQARLDTLYAWSNVLVSLRKQIATLRALTGSTTLDVTQPNTDPDVPLRQDRGHGHGHQQEQDEYRRLTDGADGTTFVDRILKEDSSQRTFEKGALTTVHALIGTARDAQVNLAFYFQEMRLPTFERELTLLISFPTNLVQAILRTRLEYARKLRDPEVLIIDQMTDDLKINIGLACTLKRQYEAFLAPDPGGNWNLPHCISKDYDSVVLEALAFLFKLIHWKLKSGAKSIYFKETDVLEGQWATFNDVSLSTAGGSALVAEQLW
jgi:mitogen-activated protein kinase kinase kinase